MQTPTMPTTTRLITRMTTRLARALAVTVTICLTIAAATVTLALGAAAAPAPTDSKASSPDGMATAWVRAAHLVPGLGPMTISLVPFAGSAAGTVTKLGVPPAPTQGGARVVAPAAAFGQASGYRQIPRGLYVVQVRRVGAAAASAPVLTGTLNAQADQAYTLAALGTIAAPRIQVLSDDLRPPKPGTASVRVLAATSAARPVTVTVVAGRLLAAGVAFGQPTGYAPVPAGDWRLIVSDGRTTSVATTSLASGSVDTLLVLDAPGGGLRVQSSVDAQGMAATPIKGVQTGGGGMATSVVN